MPELLSIAIPTRNRSKTLRDLLSDISISIEFGNVDKNHLKIYIFDNASTDDTASTVKAFNCSLPISYKVNKDNIGMGLNIFQAYTAVNGEYVWVIGDDELMPKTALMTIFSAIKELSPGLIIAREPSYKSFLRLPKVYPSYADFAKNMEIVNPHYLIAHSLISTNIVKKSFFDECAAMDAIDTYYGHMYGIASGLKACSSAVVLPKEEAILVRKIYLGPVDGFWPDSIEKEQVIYLEWVKKLYALNIAPSTVISNYRAKLMPNILNRGWNYMARKFIKIVNDLKKNKSSA